ncbi:TetR/AcrR family transcriptional regulator [Pseudofrankia asymbiotica]|uniref:TetR/AcrR family transcriptional regulator n=1 Tax=Pseudofrankia asymbiotica TaxID=1834516 RepID=UPI0009D680F0|nr:TetR/AcrR family transcriptional regulator [Pseudofrankia asymbiotica]
MTFSLPPVVPVRDRRARRSRSALLRAAVDLVGERGTAAVPISDLADAADVSRQVLYQQFGDRDALLLEAALDLARRDLMPRLGDPAAAVPGRARSLAVARHFAEHRGFYRALMTGSTAFALGKALSGLLVPFNRQLFQEALGGTLDARTMDDLAMCLAGGGQALVCAWLIEGEDPLDPEEFADRTTRMVTVLVSALLTVHAPGGAPGALASGQPGERTIR